MQNKILLTIICGCLIFSTQTLCWSFFGESKPKPIEPIAIEKPQHEQLDKLSKEMLSTTLEEAYSLTNQDERYYLWNRNWRYNYRMPNENPPTYCTCCIDPMTGLYPDVICWWINILQKRDFQTLQDLEFKNRILFYGPPGNGKTRIANTIAKIANADFVSISTPTIVKRYVGDGVKCLEEVKQRINQTLNKKIKLEDGTEIIDTTTPIVLFFDEIDALASDNSSESRAEHKATLQHLWMMLDAYENNSRVFIFFATNHIDLLNKAFLNRFDAINKIEIKNPDAAMRKELIKTSFEKLGITFSGTSIKQNSAHIKYIFEATFLDNIVQATEGFSIRQILGIVRSIKVLADIRNKGQINGAIIVQVLAQMQESAKLERQEEENDLLIKQFDTFNKKLTLVSQIRQIYRTYVKMKS